MRILLSGSTSFLGSKFIELYEREHQITGFSKHDKANPVDMTDKKALNEVFEKTQPEVIIHLAAIVDNDASKVKEPNIQGTKNLVELAERASIPFVFMSSESVYGGKTNGDYHEDDPYKPRSVYAETKVKSEKVIRDSNLDSYLILRGHRFVGINKNYDKPKQFPDTLKALEKGETIHLDSQKLFKPTLINHISNVFDHYLSNHKDEKHILNIGVEKATTYYDFIVDVAKELGLNANLIKPDGDEAGWPINSTLNVEKLHNLGYPTLSYKELLRTLREEYKA